MDSANGLENWTRPGLDGVRKIGERYPPTSHAFVNTRAEANQEAWRIS